MLGKKYGPAIVLPILMACFGSFTLLTGRFADGKVTCIYSLVLVAAQNFGGMMTLRWFLGEPLPFSPLESQARPFPRHAFIRLSDHANLRLIFLYPSILTLHRNVRSSFLPIGHLLPNYLLPTRRTRSPPRNLLRSK